MPISSLTRWERRAYFSGGVKLPSMMSEGLVKVRA